MTQKPEGEAMPAATERAEQLLHQTGQRLGLLAGQARQRLQQAMQSSREEADRMDVPASAKTGPRSGRAGAQATRIERAEELVDRLGQRLGQWATVNGVQAKRMVARLREDTEDMWIEAQQIRAGWEGKRERAPRV